MSNPSNALPSNSNNPLDDQHDILRQHIQDSLRRAEAQRNRLKTIDRRYSIVTLCLSAVATFIAGQSAVSNDPLVGNWRATTTVASILTLGATISGGIQRQLATPDLLNETSECVAKLKALNVETVVSGYEIEQVSDEYQQILSTFSNVDC